MATTATSNVHSHYQNTVKQGGVVPLESRAVGAWQVCGMSHAGKYGNDGKPVADNQDAFIVLEGPDKSFLVAVADGTGDSQDGARAARVALEALATNWRSSSDVGAAVTAAALLVQEDNRVGHLDGACTLTAMTLSGNHAEAVHVGDARYYLLNSEGRQICALVDKSKRLVLGGEPLGNIITSSGYIVREVEQSNAHPVVNITSPTRFVLTSDGAFFQDNEDDDFAQIREILEKHSNPSDAATAIVNRALEAFRLGVTKSDNVTAIVGYLSSANTLPSRD